MDCFVSRTYLTYCRKECTSGIVLASVKQLAKYYDPYGARKHDYKPLNTYLAAKCVQYGWTVRMTCL